MDVDCCCCCCCCASSDADDGDDEDMLTCGLLSKASIAIYYCYEIIDVFCIDELMVMEDLAGTIIFAPT